MFVLHQFSIAWENWKTSWKRDLDGKPPNMLLAMESGALELFLKAYSMKPDEAGITVFEEKEVDEGFLIVHFYEKLIFGNIGGSHSKRKHCG